MVKQRQQLYVWDFTCKHELKLDEAYFIEELKRLCKKWGFQFEKGEKTGYLHWQGRFSLFNKMEKHILIKEFTECPCISLRATSNNCKGSKFYDYTTKEDTRVRGPWTDKMASKFIPPQYKNIMNNLHPFQKSILKISEAFDKDNINFIYNPQGGVGKSTIVHCLRLYRNAIKIPIHNDGLRIIAAVCNILTAKNLRTDVNLFVDMPKAFDPNRSEGIYCALEELKAGYAYDERNKWKDWDFASPNIFVFGNTLPDMSLLTARRWAMWSINKKLELVPLVNGTGVFGASAVTSENSVY